MSVHLHITIDNHTVMDRAIQNFNTQPPELADLHLTGANKLDIWRMTIANIIAKTGLQMELGKQTTTLGPAPARVEVTVTTRPNGGWTVDYEPST
jgi:hypothetical protein